MSAAPATIAARPATPDDAVLGVAPKGVVSPASVAEASAALAEAAGARARVAFVGGGTALGLGAPPRGLDLVLRTERLARVVEYAPSDQVVTVEAGIPLGALQTALAVHGQRLALDPPHPARATLGGLLATNAFGPLRVRYGTLRDLVLGVTLVRADGVAAKGGGKVVKNVAGFDLPKMAVGSLGTLGLVATATFRVHPLPERTRTLLLKDRSCAEVRAGTAALKDAQLEPAAVVALFTGDRRFDLAMRFEGFEAGVTEQLERTMGLTAKTGPRGEVLDEPAARAFWERHDAVRAGGPLRAKVSMLPTKIEDFLEGKRREPGGPGAEGGAGGALLRSLAAPALAVYPTLGILFLSGNPGDELEATRRLSAARSFLAAPGGHLVLEEAPAGVRARVDVWGPAPPALSLMKSLKDRLDPHGLLNPGRFTGGI